MFLMFLPTLSGDLIQPTMFPLNEHKLLAFDRLSSSRQDPASWLPPSYKFVAKAGSGQRGDVYFCLPKSSLRSAKAKLSTPTDSGVALEHLATQLVAIKTDRTSSFAPFSEEIQALGIIKAWKLAAGGDTSQSPSADLFTLLDYSAMQPSPTNRPYICTSTLPLVCPMTALSALLTSAAEILTWHLYTRIDSVLSWLHTTCSPAIAHKDIHAGNILIGYKSLTDSGSAALLPEVKLVDFGISSIASMNGGDLQHMFFDQDVRNDSVLFICFLCRLLGAQSQLGWTFKWEGKDSSLEMQAFKEVVEGVHGKSSRECEAALLGLQDKFGGFARKTLADVGGDVCGVIRAAVMEATRQGQDEVRAGLQKLIGWSDT